MQETFGTLLAVGGKTNSLGRANEVLTTVLNDASKLKDLYLCVLHEDAWVRMRAIDTLEKVCRVHPEWLEPYVDRLLHEVATIDQASIQWHLAELFREIDLSLQQRQEAIAIMKRNIASNSADWIVASNTMNTLAGFVIDGILPSAELVPLLEIQQTHHSKAVVKCATRLLDQLTEGRNGV